jgi:DNA modification methylase
VREHITGQKQKRLNQVLYKDLSFDYQSPSALKPYENNPRTHSKMHIRQLANSIAQFGFNVPIVVNAENTIIAGHGRHQAAMLLKMDRVPTARIEHLSRDQFRAYVLADNRLAENAGWDQSILAAELQELLDVEDFDIRVTGFEIPEIDLILEEARQEPDKAETLELQAGPAVTRTDDIWLLGKHRLYCGSALEEKSYSILMSDRRAHVIVTDPPYNVPINGNVCGKGSIHHREFVMASGEMNSDEFVHFLNQCLKLWPRFCHAGAILYVCMDWRHAWELLQAGKQCRMELLNVCVWVKTNGGMGSFYRSRHEFVFVFKNGKKRHRNNIQLGRYGRNRTNVWEYPGVNTISTSSEEGKLLALHPTVKPIAMVADALLDCSARGDLVLDPFLGSGTTLLAAERVGRCCYGIEIDPLYVDVAICRWQKLTGERAIHQSGTSFDELAQEAY